MLVTTVTALTAVTVALWVGGHLNPLICDGDCGADAAAVPDSLTLTPAPVVPDASVTSTRDLDPDAVRAAVASALADERLGEQVGFAAVDPQTRDVLVTIGDGTFVPASTAKLLTAFAALATLDPQRHFATSVVRSGDQLVLVGGGDPYLMSKPPKEPYAPIRATLRELADRTATSLRRDRVTSVRLGYDASLFGGPALNPTWESSYVSERLVTPISALWADQVLRSQAQNPARSAAEDFAELLDRRGIEVIGEPRSTAAPSGARRVAQVRGGSIAQATELMVSASDNDAAEMLLRHVAVAAGRPGTFADGTAVVGTTLRSNGIDVTGLELQDGSGLSRENRIAPATLAQVVAAAAAEARTAGLIAGLPVARFSGSLAARFGEARDGAGIVRAKTGTLTGVHSLAGYATDRNGAPIAFAVMVDKTRDISGIETEAALDRVGEALARCSCSLGRAS